MADNSGYPDDARIRRPPRPRSDTSDGALVWGRMDIKTVFITDNDDTRHDEVKTLIAVAIARFIAAGTPVDSRPEVRMYPDVENEEVRPC